ncbi:hypothetical protein [Niveispirillum sp.]|uniref:hypothetical protein n=1 Tax=Niveispirillum sp. TaxID=1917217 RepID=UPI001B59CCBF|nr:hypothetical protein [Niveispirillum sp.]MBP7335080.1 hypothetical protein [Niveispirillum sp.]
MSISSPGDKTLPIKITCRYVPHEGGGVVPALFYNGQPDKNLSILVPPGYDKISFYRDLEAQEVPFFFTGANVTPIRNQAGVCDDLKLASVTDEAVTVSDTYLHVGDHAVGDVTLFYFIQDFGGNGDGPTGGFASDPEIINTGRD